MLNNNEKFNLLIKVNNLKLDYQRLEQDKEKLSYF